MSASLHSDREERDNLELALVISVSTPASLFLSLSFPPSLSQDVTGNKITFRLRATCLSETLAVMKLCAEVYYLQSAPSSTSTCSSCSLMPIASGKTQCHCS